MTFQFEQKMRCSSMVFCLIKTEFKLSVKRKSPHFLVCFRTSVFFRFGGTAHWGAGCGVTVRRRRNSRPGAGHPRSSDLKDCSDGVSVATAWQLGRPEWRGENSAALRPSPLMGEGAAGLGSQLPGRCGKAPCDWVALMASPRASSVVSISTSSSCCLESLDLSSFSS